MEESMQSNPQILHCLRIRKIQISRRFESANNKSQLPFGQGVCLVGVKQSVVAVAPWVCLLTKTKVLERNELLRVGVLRDEKCLASTSHYCGVYFWISLIRSRRSLNLCQFQVQ